MVEHLENIGSYLSKQGSVAVAFSGGVDSSLLAFLANKVLGDKAHIFTIATPYMSKKEIANAQFFADTHKLNHHTITLDIPTEIKNNPTDRCYLCKKRLFSALVHQASDLGLNTIFDGSNADDLGDYRPGMRALKELKIASPLLDLGINKSEVRTLSKHLGLETWNLPSNPCLLTRLPYNVSVSAKALKQVEEAEDFLHGKGFSIVRVRHQGDTARIELPQEQRALLLESPFCEDVRAAFKLIGFTFVSVDLKGFASGSMNQAINNLD